MAEVIDIPKPSVSAVTREHSSLDKPMVSKANEVEHKEAVVLKKPSFKDRIKETFTSVDINDVTDYIIWDIVIPGIGGLLDDAICGASHRIFRGGNPAPSNLNRNRGVTRVARTDYNSLSTRTRTVDRGIVKYETQPAPTNRRGDNYHLNDWGPISRTTAETILSRAVEVLEEFGKLSVDQYYAIAEEYLDFDFHVDYTAQKWGWRSLNTAEITNVPGGSVIKLPRIVAL